MLTSLTHFLGQQVHVLLITASWGAEQLDERQHLSHTNICPWTQPHTTA